MKVWEKKNRELRSVWRWFAARASVSKVNWRPGIKRGKKINVGTALADLVFDDGTTEVLEAPLGCQGKIAATNRRVFKEGLAQPPSQWFLRLDP